jgi:NADPH-dependent 2,4-dienoyl-CoA reductase/sulfur reductase-like enzyme
MEKLADRYAELAECVKFCGFDILLIHGGHGTLLQEFISPRSNFREDDFGGSMEKRSRFPIMVLDRIRERVGRDLLIEYRISGSERVPGGFEIEDCIEFTKLIQDRIDIIHISAGVVREPRLRAITHPTGFLPPGCNAYLAAAVKAVSDIHLPVLTVGGFQYPQMIEETLSEGKADLVAMARGTIADPYTVNKAKSGQDKEIVPCIKCFQCLDEFKDTHYYSCSVNPYAGRESMMEMLIPREYTKKKVAVIGGGPGGMYAAMLAVERGHTVTLYEKKETLGGQLDHVDHISFKYDLLNYRNYLIDHVMTCGATVILEAEVTPELLQAEGYDSIICAIGASPVIPPIPGVEGKNVIWAVDGIRHPERTGKNIVVIGGGQVGCETAVYFGMSGKDVTVMEMQSSLAPDAMRTYREELQGQVDDHCSAVLLSACCSKINDNGVLYTDQDGKECSLTADTVILAAGMKPRSTEAEVFRECAQDFRRIGDCFRVGNVKHAIRAAFDAAMTL